MSLAGKILIVLILLLTLVWIFEAAQVAELNRNWGQKIVSLQGQLDQVKQELAEVRTNVVTAQAGIVLEQHTREDELTRLRSQVANLQKIDSYTRETLDRFTNQLASTEAQLASAQQRQQFREQEENQTRQELANAITELNTLVRQNNDLLDHLATLRDEFQQTVNENKALVQQIEQSRAAGRARTRAASLAR